MAAEITPGSGPSNRGGTPTTDKRTAPERLPNPAEQRPGGGGLTREEAQP